jgi:hypothetical protein
VEFIDLPQPPIVVQRAHRRELKKLGYVKHLYAGR